MPCNRERFFGSKKSQDAKLRILYRKFRKKADEIEQRCYLEFVKYLKVEYTH